MVLKRNERDEEKSRIYNRVSNNPSILYPALGSIEIPTRVPG